jgi:hypothetical protein
MNRSVAVNYIEENTQRSKVAIAYVYCDYNDPKTKCEIELLSSITRQLAEQSKPMPPEVNAFRDKYAEKRRHPTGDERISIVRTISELFERTYVFVDALVIHLYLRYSFIDSGLLIRMSRMNALRQTGKSSSAWPRN